MAALPARRPKLTPVWRAENREDKEWSAQAASQLGHLPPRLAALVDRLELAAERARLAKFFSAAAALINSLDEVDPSRFDGPAAAGGVAVWAELEPLVNDSLASVGDFLELVRDAFPVDDLESDAALDAVFANVFDAAADVPARGPEDELRIGVAEAVVPICGSLSRDLAIFRTAARAPTVLSDPWTLLSQLSRFRGNCAIGVAEMVFAGASVLGPVRRSDVVPAYDAIVMSGVRLRKAVGKLRRRIGWFVRWAQQGGDQGGVQRLQGWLAQTEQELEAFAASPDFAHLWAADRRVVNDKRAEIKQLAARFNLAPPEARGALEGVAHLLESLEVISRRQTVAMHDQETLASLRERLANLQSYPLAEELPALREALGKLLLAADELRGLSSAFDDLLHLMSRIDLEAQPIESLRTMTATLERAITQLAE